MTEDKWVVTKKSTRPLGSQDECFYCKEKIGSQHKADCVIRQRTIVVNCTIEMVMAVPENWDEDAISFRYNEGTYCADNIVKELTRYLKREENEALNVPCLCERTLFQYVREANKHDENTWGIGIHDIKRIEA